MECWEKVTRFFPFESEIWTKSTMTVIPFSISLRRSSSMMMRRLCGSVQMKRASIKSFYA